MKENVGNSYIGGWVSLRKHPLIKELKSDALLKEFSFFRDVKGDGNCFYYTFLSQLIEYLKSTEEKDYIDFEKNLEIINKEYESLKKEEVIYKDFYEAFLKVVRQCRNNNYDIENIPDFDLLGAVTYIKMLIVTELMSKKDTYEPFLVDMKIEEYCQKKIEPLFKETEHLEMQALSNLLKISIAVLSIKKNSFEKVHFGDDNKFLFLLHTSNHFEPIK